MNFGVIATDKPLEDQAGSSWADTIKRIESETDNYKFDSAVLCDMGLAEEVHGLLIYTKGEGEEQKFFFHVGTGECLRGYRKHYEGDDPDLSSEAFYEEIERSMKYRNNSSWVKRTRKTKTGG